MKVNKIKEELNKKTKDELKKYQFIGAEFKNSRLKLSKTLESISNVNKSVSYISKVENNKIIPNEECIRELCDELFIKKESLDSMSSFDDALLVALKAIYMNDEKMMNTLYEQYSNFTNIRTELMTGLYFYFTNDFVNLSVVVNNLSKIESSLSIEDYLIFVLLSIKELLHKKEILQVYKIIEVVEKSYTAKDFIKKIFEQIKYEILLNFGLSNCSLESNKIIEMHLETFNVEQAIKNKYLHIEKMIELGSREFLINEFNNLNDNNLKLLNACRLNDVKIASTLIDDNTNEIYLINYYYITKNLQGINNCILKGNLNEELLIKANFYKLKLENNDNNLRDFLVNICIPYYFKMCKMNYLFIYFDELVCINSKCSKYKEISNVSNELSKLLQEIISVVV